MVSSEGDKKIEWNKSDGNWSSNQDWNLITGKSFKINNDVVLNNDTLGNNIVNSSLETVGTINTGVWEASKIDMRYTQLQGGRDISLNGNILDIDDVFLYRTGGKVDHCGLLMIYQSII